MALPQVSVARAPSELISTGRAGRLRVISASSRPETSRSPSSSTVDRHRRLGGHVVVEAGQGQVPGRLQPDARQHRDGGPGRQRPGSPGHGLSQHVAFHLDLHRNLPPLLMNVRSGGRAGFRLPAGWVSREWVWHSRLPGVPGARPACCVVDFSLRYKNVVAIGSVDAGDSRCIPSSAREFASTGAVRRGSVAGDVLGTAGRFRWIPRSAPTALAALSPDSPKPVHRDIHSLCVPIVTRRRCSVLVHPDRACCLIRLVSSVTWL